MTPRTIDRLGWLIAFSAALGIALLSNAVVEKWRAGRQAPNACVEELVQVKRGITYTGDSAIEFKCSSPKQQLVQAMPYAGQGSAGDGVYVCRCVDLHAVATKQETQLSILFQRLDWMEKNGWAPPASSTQMQSVQQRLDMLEQREKKP